MKLSLVPSILMLATSFQHVSGQESTSETTISDFIETLYCSTEWRCGDSGGRGGRVTSFSDLPFTEDELIAKMVETDPKYADLTVQDLKERPDIQERIQRGFDTFSGGGCKVYGSCLYDKSDTRTEHCEDYGSDTTYRKCCCQKQDIVHRFFDSVMDLIDNTWGPGWDGRRLSSSPAKMIPQVMPKHENTKVLNEEVGIYAMPSFIEDEEADTLVDFVNRYGEKLGQFEECSSKANKGLGSTKVCMKLSPDKAQNEEDRLYLTNIMRKMKGAWISGTGVEHDVAKDYFDVQRVTGESKGMTRHADALNLGTKKNAHPVTFSLYLSDSEAGVQFPNADNVVITPKKGMAATWHNSYIDGTMNDKATHFVQDKKDGSPDRYIIVYQFTVPSEEEIEN